MTHEFLTENAALETEITEAASFLGNDAKFIIAFEAGDTAEMGRLLNLVIHANRASNHATGVIYYVESTRHITGY